MSGRPAIRTATQVGTERLRKALVKAINFGDADAFMRHASDPFFHTEILIARGPNVKGKWTTTPLAHASHQLGYSLGDRELAAGLKAIIDFLLERGANPSALNAYDESALASIVGSEHIDVGAKLLAAGASANQSFRGGARALHSLSMKGGFRGAYASDWLTLLLAHGAEVNVSDDQRRTPLSIAMNAQAATEADLKKQSDPERRERFKQSLMAGGAFVEALMKASPGQNWPE